MQRQIRNLGNLIIYIPLNGSKNVLQKAFLVYLLKWYLSLTCVFEYQF